MSLLDCSGAPPILMPFEISPSWRGVVDSATGYPRDLDLNTPRTDYDRACGAAKDSNSILRVGSHECLVLYTESDSHLWVGDLRIVMCGDWIPRPELMESVAWSEELFWRCSYSNPILFNSSIDGSQGITKDDDYIETSLQQGLYRVSTALITDGSSEGIVHRFSLAGKSNASDLLYP